MVTTTHETTIDMTFAERITTIRHQQGLTQTALAERANTHISNIRRYEAGTSTPTLDALRNLALALNTSADTLIFDPEERQPTNELLHAFQAASTRLDPQSQEHLKATIEGLLLRAETRRWAS